MRTTLISAMALLLVAGFTSGPAHAAVTSTSASHPSAGTSAPAPATTAPEQTGAAATAQDFSSIFSGGDAALAGSGWISCPTPIQWTVDTDGLTASQAEAQIANLTWAFAQWSQVSGLNFAYAGTERLAYDDATFDLGPADGSPAQLHHIYLDFVTSDQSTRLDGSTVGLGSPTQVMASTKEIVAGDAVFRTDHVQRARAKELRSLYLHELGHVLGLAHASATANVMFPIVKSKVSLGAGDVNGVQAMTKPCAS